MKQWIRVTILALLVAAGVAVAAGPAVAGDPSQWIALAGDPSQWGTSKVTVVFL